MKSLTAFFLFVLCLSSCAVKFDRTKESETAAAEKSANAGNKTENKNTYKNDSEPESAKNIFGENGKNRTDCAKINTGDKKLLVSQTFPFDFAPYKNSCFVTAHDPEYDDPPLDSEFSIYRDGKEIFFFPNQFNGVTTGCWVEAVSFQDLNNDNLTDIIVVGKCSAKTAPYNENTVYVNTGITFTTDEDANYKLADFQTIKDITDFVKRNKQLFF